MYREELVKEIKSCTDGAVRNRLLSEFYFANLGLVVTLCNSCSTSQNCREDLMQLAYIALDKAVEKFDASKGFSILSNYRMWFKNECYKFWVSNGSGIESCQDGVRSDYQKEEDACWSSKMFWRVEADFMNRLLWERVTVVLGRRDSILVKRRYVLGHTLKVLSESYGITIEGVRKRIIRSCERLREDGQVQEIAHFYNYL